MFKLLTLTFLCALSQNISALEYPYNCTEKSALLILKRPIYEFSVKLLDRVAQETDEHFVFSPISTYMQLVALAEGARGNTSAEIWNVTRFHRRKCFRRKWKMILNRIDAHLGPNTQKKSLIVLDRLVRVKPAYIREIGKLKSMQVLPLPFTDPEGAADIANNVINDATSGVISDVFSPFDFNYTVLLTADTSYYRSDWQIPFNPAYTKPETFHSGEYTDQVYMMNRIDYFHMADIAAIRARVLELPCGSHNRVSMLVFLPNGDIRDVFYNLQKIRLMSIFNTFKLEKKKLVEVKMPRFKVRSEIDNLPELLYDMGVRSLFHPNTANLKGISDYKIYASLMTQVADIDVDERGVRAGVVAESLVANKTRYEEFRANRPFAFILVDRKTEVIMFAGIYSKPNTY